jgi:D-threo-aldose 1-dehydrogenase
MIPRTQLPGTELSLSRLTFGTSRLFSAGSRSARHALLETAAQAGFTHFDTAPSYGFGMAERDLGDLFGRDDAVTVTTKTGLYSPGGEGQSWPTIFGRKLLGRVVTSLSRPVVDWSVSTARRALDDSLKRLKRDHVSILLLHEAELPLLDTDEWQRWMAAERQARVGSYGVAVDAERLKSILAAPMPFLEIIQAQDSVSAREAEPVLAAGRPLQFTFGYLSSLSAEERSAAGIARTIKAALARNLHGSVVVSSNQIERVRALAAASQC